MGPSQKIFWPGWVWVNFLWLGLGRLSDLHKIIIGGWRCNITKEIIAQINNRLPPRLWLKYNVSSAVVKTLGDNQPFELHCRIMENMYCNRRNNNPIVIDRSSGSIDGKSILKWTGPIISQIKKTWYGIDIKDDQLRRLLKKTFYPQSYFIFMIYPSRAK